MDADHWIQLVFLVIFVLLSAFFSSAETALTTVNKLRIRSLAEEGRKSAIRVQKILEQPSKMLSAVLIGNNIVNISASALATTFTIDVTGGNNYVGFATGILTLVVLIFGEIVPKTWANINSDSISLIYSSIIYCLMIILSPIIYFVDKFSALIFKLLRINKNLKNDSYTESELKTIVDVSLEGGLIEEAEHELIHNVFDFKKSLAKDIMIPRIDLTLADVNTSYDDMLALFKLYMYTRIPVFEDTQDNIVGIVNLKDFILIENKDDFTLSSMLHEAHFTYEFKNTDDLMLEMREKSAPMSLVLDEYGSLVGLITMEDLIEEIVGEIRDEYDEDEENLIREIAPNEYIVDGGMKLDDINDALNLNILSDDYDSIGGIIIQLLDKLPEEDEEVTTDDGIKLKVVEIVQNRIEQVHMTLPQVIESENNDEINDENNE